MGALGALTDLLRLWVRARGTVVTLMLSQNGA